MWITPYQENVFIETQNINDYFLQSLFFCDILITTNFNSLTKMAGAQPEIFQSRVGFVKLGHFDKHFIKRSRNTVPHGKILEFFSLR